MEQSLSTYMFLTSCENSFGEKLPHNGVLGTTPSRVVLGAKCWLTCMSLVYFGLSILFNQDSFKLVCLPFYSALLPTKD